MIRRLFIFSVVVLAYLVIRDRDSKPIEHSPGILVAERPLQVDLQPSTFMLDDYQLTRKASFEIRARVLSKEPYYLGRTADLAPVTSRWAGVRCRTLPYSVRLIYPRAHAGTARGTIYRHRYPISRSYSTVAICT